MAEPLQKMPPSSGEILAQAFQSRAAKNGLYSLRAFARDLDVSHTLLSLAISGKKPPSARMCARLARRMPPDLAQKMVEVARVATEREAQVKPAPQRKRRREFQSVGVKAVDRLLRRWHCLAILDLSALPDFSADPKWISGTLGIPTAKAARALSGLIEQGLLKQVKGRWVKDPGKLAIVPAGRSEKSVRVFHARMIKKALAALSSPLQEDYDARDISGSLIPIDPERLPEAKRRIRRFRRSLLDFLSRGDTTELYQLNVQLFPLTKKRAARKVAG